MNQFNLTDALVSHETYFGFSELIQIQELSVLQFY